MYDSVNGAEESTIEGMLVPSVSLAATIMSRRRNLSRFKFVKAQGTPRWISEQIVSVV